MPTDLTSLRDRLFQFYDNVTSARENLNLADAERLRLLNQEALTRGLKTQPRGEAGPMHTLRTLWGSSKPGYGPANLAQQAEGHVEFYKDFVEHLGSQVSKMGAAAFGAADVDPKTQTLPGFWQRQANELAARQHQFITNVPLLGDLGLAYQSHVNKNLAGANLPTDTVIGQKIAQGYIPAIGQTIGDVVQPVTSLITGRNAAGEKLTPKEAAYNVEAAIWLARGGGAAASKLLPRIAGKKVGVLELLEGKELPKELLDRTRSRGELEAIDMAKTANKREAGLELARRNEAARAQLELRKQRIAEDTTRVHIEDLQDPMIGEMGEAAKARITPEFRDFEFMDEWPEAIKDQFKIEETLPLEAAQAAATKLVTEPLLRQALVDAVAEEGEWGRAATRVLNNPDLMRPHINDLVATYGADLGDITKAFASAYETQKTDFGKRGSIMSNAMQEVTDSLQRKLESTKDVGETRQLLQELRKLQDLKDLTSGKGGNLATGWARAAQLLNKTEKLRIGTVLSPLRTAFGIAQGQFGLVGTDFADIMGATLSGVGQQYLAGRVPGAVPLTTTQVMSDVYGALGAMKDKIPGFGGREQMRLLLDRGEGLLPDTASRLNQGLLFDADAHIGGSFLMLAKRAVGSAKQAAQESRGLGGVVHELGEGVRAIQDVGDLRLATPGKAIYNIVDALVGYKLTANRFQEIHFRKFAFDSRLRANLARNGMSWQDMMTELGRSEIEAVGVKTKSGNPVVRYLPKEINKQLREAVVDAEIHALRQTYAYRPEGGMLGAMLKANEDFSRAVIPTSLTGILFPRAIVNNILWQAHHSPVHIADLLTPEFRDAFLQLGERKQSPVQAAATQRKIGEALTGTVMFTMAMHLADGGDIDGWRMGKKPWMLERDGDLDEQGNQRVVDLTGKQPWPSYITWAKMLRDTASGTPSSLTAQEFTDQAINVRAGDIPIFSFQESLRNMDSADPNVVMRAATDWVGQYGASWMTGIKGLREEYSSIPPEHRYKAFLGGEPLNELLNLSREPGFSRHYRDTPLTAPAAVVGSPSTLEQHSPFTGGTTREQNPFMYNLQLARKSQTPMERLLLSTPGFDPNTVIKRYEDPHATQLVREAFGTVLKSTRFQDFARELDALGAVKVNDIVLKQVLPVLRQAAEALAMSRDAQANNGKPIHFATELTKGANPLNDRKVQEFLRGLVLDDLQTLQPQTPPPQQ